MHSSAPLLRSAAVGLRVPFRPLPTLPDATLATFRRHAFHAEQPMLFPRGAFASLMPAIDTWFHAPALAPSSSTSRDPAAIAWRLNVPALLPFGEVAVQTELTAITSPTSPASSQGDVSFHRAEAPLGFFLQHIAAKQQQQQLLQQEQQQQAAGTSSTAFPSVSSSSSSARTNPPDTGESLFIAQSPLAQLPPGLRAAVPTPDIVRRAGRGDVYDASLWLGLAPTVTPLHRDPNPNVLVQLAGRKTVRLLSPEGGAALRRHVGLHAGAEGGMDVFAGRGRAALERAVWGAEGGEGREGGGGREGREGRGMGRDGRTGRDQEKEAGEEVDEEVQAGWEAHLESGDGLFIPTGWWHAVHGLGPGVTGSVNWWFR